MNLLLIILSLCKGKLLTDLTRDLHKQQYEKPLKPGKGLPYIPRAKHKILNVLNELGLSWNSAEKRFLPDFRLIEPKLRSIKLGRIALMNLHQLESNFT